MEILNNFGFEPILFVAQIVNFLIIFWVLKRFMYKPVLKLLDERKKKIEDGLKHAEEAEKRLTESIQKEEEMLKKAQSEAKKMISEANIAREKMLKDAEVDTKEQIAKMLAEARSQIQDEASAASKKLEVQVSKLAIEFLKKSTKDLFGEKEQDIIVKSALKKLK